MRALLLSLLILSFITSTPTLALRAPASVTPGLEAQETELESEIDRQADLVFKQFVATSGSSVPLTTLQRSKRALIFRLKQMHVLTDILKASGPAPATTLLATELLTNFVLAPIATAMGRPATAGLMITVPWGVVTGFGVFSFQIMRERFAISRELGGASLRKLDRLRKLVVGYDIKNRVSSALYQSLVSDEATVDILNRSWSFEDIKVPALTVKELEDLVRTSGPEGTRYLSSIYMEKLDAAFYSSLLLRFVNESDVLTAKLVSTVRSRTSSLATADDSLSLRRHLIGIDDVKKQIEREIHNLQSIRGGLDKRVDAGEVSEAEAARIERHSREESARLLSVKGRLLRHEYATLLEAQAMVAGSADAVKTAKVAPERSTELMALAVEAREREVRPAVAGEVLKRRFSVMRQVRAAVRSFAPRPLVCQALFQ